MGPIKLREGMLVYSTDGAKLGKIVECRPDGFVIEKGMFFPKASLFRYEDVVEQRDGEICLGYAQSQLADPSWWTKRETAAQLERSPETEAQRATAQPSRMEAAALGTATGPDVIRVPLAEEQITAEKRMRDLGEVRVHKRVVVEKKQITVPVMHEEVYVERVPVDAKAAPLATDGSFVEKTITIPLHEEEVQIFKRPVVREEVRVTRKALQEEKTATTEVRREEIDIDQPKGLTGHLHLSH